MKILVNLPVFLIKGYFISGEKVRMMKLKRMKFAKSPKKVTNDGS